MQKFLGFVVVFHWTTVSADANIKSFPSANHKEGFYAFIVTQLQEMELYLSQRLRCVRMIQDRW